MVISRSRRRSAGRAKLSSLLSRRDSWARTIAASSALAAKDSLQVSQPLPLTVVIMMLDGFVRRLARRRLAAPLAPSKGVPTAAVLVDVHDGVHAVPSRCPCIPVRSGQKSSSSGGWRGQARAGLDTADSCSAVWVARGYEATKGSKVNYRRTQGR